MRQLELDCWTYRCSTQDGLECIYDMPRCYLHKFYFETLFNSLRLCLSFSRGKYSVVYASHGHLTISTYS